MSVLTSPALRYARANSGITFRPDANTVLWLPGQDDPQSATIRDRSITQDDGAIAGATWAQTGQGLWYLDFDGTNDIVTVTAPYYSYTTEITVEAWVRVDTTIRALAGQGDLDADNATKNMWFWLPFGTFEFQWYINDTGTWRYCDITSLFTASQWHHLVTTGGTAGLEVFLDGVSKDTATGLSTGIPNNATSVIHLGRDPRDTAYGYHDGGMALFRVYNRVLGDAEITSHYNQERHLFNV